MIYLVGIVVFAIALLLSLTYLQRRMSTLDREYFKLAWEQIEDLAAKKQTWVQAIVDADKLLDEVLKQLNTPGSSLADRMVSANRSFSNANNIWTAHKIRNKVVHETKFKLNKRHVNGAIKSYKQALKDLGAL